MKEMKGRLQIEEDVESIRHELSFRRGYRAGYKDGESDAHAEWRVWPRIPHLKISETDAFERDKTRGES